MPYCAFARQRGLGFVLFLLSGCLDGSCGMRQHQKFNQGRKKTSIQPWVVRTVPLAQSIVIERRMSNRRRLDCEGRCVPIAMLTPCPCKRPCAVFPYCRCSSSHVRLSQIVLSEIQLPSLRYHQECSIVRTAHVVDHPRTIRNEMIDFIRSTHSPQCRWILPLRRSMRMVEVRVVAISRKWLQHVVLQVVSRCLVQLGVVAHSLNHVGRNSSFWSRIKSRGICTSCRTRGQRA